MVMIEGGENESLHNLDNRKGHKVSVAAPNGSRLNVFPIPLVGYGGLEQVAYHLAEGLRRRMRVIRKYKHRPKTVGNCAVCGFSLTVDLHHEGFGKTYILCPSHHALITRGISTLQELLPPK